jgi:hypothetical protein
MFSPKRLFSFLSIVCIAILLAGCNNPTGGDEVPRFGPKVAATFAGTWTSTGGDSFIVDIAATPPTFTYSAGDPLWDMDYSGEIVGEVQTDHSLLESQWGYLTFRITGAGAYGPTSENFFVIHWKNLTTNSVEEAGAYKSDGKNAGTTTIQEAVVEYTVDNNYFGGFGTYTK